MASALSGPVVLDGIVSDEKLAEIGTVVKKHGWRYSKVVNISETFGKSNSASA
jgi:hypothetical protein